ncbi:unnamed protein product [Urochloa decumbens]|uniref:F-box protein AT5G49610-like beta-propeller domain-containing protein n=1 Tax=Urochloa decumbens TaxID=240449 RepID=A0ABC9G728_9POAL
MGIRGSRRRRKITSKQDRKMEQPVTSVDELSNDLLELVLLGLDSSVSLTRAAATCKRWRRVVADVDGAFLRRFRALHVPSPVGHFYYSVDADPPCSFGMSHTFPQEDPVFVPSSGRHGRPLISLDFVPSAGDGKRQVVDSHGSLLLILYGVGIVMGAFLLDGDADDAAGGGIGMDNFRVVLVLYEPDRDDHDKDLFDNDEWYRHGWPYTAVFSRGGDGGIECVISFYDFLSCVYLPNIEEVHLAGRTGGRVFWGCEDQQVIVLDECTLELSTMAFPDHMTWGFHASNFRVVSVYDNGSTVRIVCITSSGDLEVRSYTFHGDDSDESDDEWVVEKRVELAEASLHLPGRKEGYFRCLPVIIAATEEFVMLSPSEETWLFSMDLRTMELEREHERNRYKAAGYPCAPPWPPVMHACVGD